MGLGGRGLRLESAASASAPEFRRHPARLPVVGNFPLATISGGRPGLGAKVGLGGLDSLRALGVDDGVGIRGLGPRHVPRAGLSG